MTSVEAHSFIRECPAGTRFAIIANDDDDRREGERREEGLRRCYIHNMDETLNLQGRRDDTINRRA